MFAVPEAPPRFSGLNGAGGRADKWKGDDDFQYAKEEEGGGVEGRMVLVVLCYTSAARGCHNLGCLWGEGRCNIVYLLQVVCLI